MNTLLIIGSCLELARKKGFVEKVAVLINVLNYLKCTSDVKSNFEAKIYMSK